MCNQPLLLGSATLREKHICSLCDEFWTIVAPRERLRVLAFLLVARWYTSVFRSQFGAFHPLEPANSHAATRPKTKADDRKEQREDKAGLDQRLSGWFDDAPANLL